MSKNLILKPIRQREEWSNSSLVAAFINDAARYANAAQRLAIADLVMPRLHLWCHAFELTFKAYILANGGDQAETRRLGHDLEAALKRSVELGLKLRNPDTKQVVILLNAFHIDHAFRYRNTNDLFMPLDAVMMGAFFAVHGMAKSQIFPEG